MRDYFDGPISVVEELDPEPEPAKWLHLREVLLGLLLLGGVLAWGGWDWWQQETNQTNYRMAEAAADAQNWDQALELFSRVKGFKDADTRAAEMNKLVTERDKQYDIAAASSQKGNWAGALQAAQAVRSIQKNYRDTSQLEAQASWEVYRGALHGAVALRTQAGKPALYYRGASRWEWLPRSDRRSQVLRTLDASGAIVYDVPGENWDQIKLTPTATPDAEGQTPGSPSLKGRTLQVARYGNNEASHYFGVNFDPSVYNSYWVGEKGMWAFRLPEGWSSRPPRVAMLGIGGVEVTYQAFGSSKAAAVAIQSGWISVEFAPDGEHILVVDQGTGSNPGQPLELYLADGYGGNRKLLYTIEGSFQGMQFSPDSKYALLTTYSYRPGNTEMFKVILIDLVNNTSTTLIDRALAYNQQRTNYPAPLAGAFITEGPLTGYSLVIENAGDRAYSYLFAPNAPAVPVFKLPAGEVPSNIIWVALRGESTLLAWQEQAGSFGSGGPLNLLEIRPDISTDKLTLPMGGKGFLAFAGIRGVNENWLVYGSREYGGGGNRPPLYSVFALPVSQPRAGDKTPEPIYSTGPNGVYMYSDRLPDGSRSAFARAAYPGSTLLSYIDKGELHVRTYDSSVDLTLENGVLYLYDPLFNASWVQLR